MRGDQRTSKEKRKTYVMDVPGAPVRDLCCYGNSHQWILILFNYSLCTYTFVMFVMCYLFICGNQPHNVQKQDFMSINLLFDT